MIATCRLSCKHFEKSGAKSNGQILYFIKPNGKEFWDQKHIWIVSCCQGIAGSQVSFCLTMGNRDHLRTEGRETSPCQGTVLRAAAHFSPQVPEHEEGSQPSASVLKCSLSCPLNYLFLYSKDINSFHDPLFAD